jgi:2-oxo-4-hydroxy-4-carboxy-5-ureidoimidazoline decarboxylase
MAIKQVTLHEINTFDQDQFVDYLGVVFEGPPWIVEAAWSARPFSSLSALFQALCEAMYHAPLASKISLLQAHPDLVGRAALAGTLSSASTGEQVAAGLSALSTQEIATFTRLNREYRDRFKFPFVICARENKKDSILAGFAARLHNTRSQEIEMALAEVAKICLLRLHDLVRADESGQT